MSNKITMNVAVEFADDAGKKYYNSSAQIEDPTTILDIMNKVGMPMPQETVKTMFDGQETITEDANKLSEKTLRFFHSLGRNMIDFASMSHNTKKASENDSVLKELNMFSHIGQMLLTLGDASGAVTQITLPDADNIVNGETITIHNIRGAGGDVSIFQSSYKS